MITVQLIYGGVPPVAPTFESSAVETVPAGSGLAVLMVSVDGLTVRANALTRFGALPRSPALVR